MVSVDVKPNASFPLPSKTAGPFPKGVQGSDRFYLEDLAGVSSLQDADPIPVLGGDYNHFSCTDQGNPWPAMYPSCLERLWRQYLNESDPFSPLTCGRQI